MTDADSLADLSLHHLLGQPGRRLGAAGRPDTTSRDTTAKDASREAAGWRPADGGKAGGCGLPIRVCYAEVTAWSTGMWSARQVSVRHCTAAGRACRSGRRRRAPAGRLGHCSVAGFGGDVVQPCQYAALTSAWAWVVTRDQVANSVHRTPLPQASSEEPPRPAPISPAAPSMLTSSGARGPRCTNSSRNPAQGCGPSLAPGASPTSTGLPQVVVPRRIGSARAPGGIRKWDPSRYRYASSTA